MVMPVACRLAVCVSAILISWHAGMISGRPRRLKGQGVSYYQRTSSSLVSTQTHQEHPPPLPLFHPPQTLQTHPHPRPRSHPQPPRAASCRACVSSSCAPSSTGLCARGWRRPWARSCTCGGVSWRTGKEDDDDEEEDAPGGEVGLFVGHGGVRCLAALSRLDGRMDGRRMLKPLDKHVGTPVDRPAPDDGTE